MRTQERRKAVALDWAEQRGVDRHRTGAPPTQQAPIHCEVPDVAVGCLDDERADPGELARRPGGEVGHVGGEVPRARADNEQRRKVLAGVDRVRAPPRAPEPVQLPMRAILCKTKCEKEKRCENARAGESGGAPLAQSGARTAART